MDKYTIFDQAGTATATATAVAPAREVGVLTECARRDLEAALQLLAERAHYLTGASGTSIALREDGEMVCRASAGQAAPEVGAEIEIDSGLIAETVRTRQVIRCDDADGDPRVNRESCQELGVKSVIVMPLLREEEVIGLFEIVADRASAFEERDVAALTRLVEMALTALEHADAAQRSLPEMFESQDGEALSEVVPEAAEPVQPMRVDQEVSSPVVEQSAPASAEFARIGSCQSCGFPVSQGRTLCVDCEQAGRSTGNKPTSGDALAFSHSNALGHEESWWQAHSYTLGALFIAALTVALLALKMR
jgi:putative methionine-R-sulfoxide reductase with GAF domain